MKKVYLILLLMAVIVQSAMSQSISGTVTQVPCNNDGIYTVTTTGIPLPITYTYYVNGTIIVHSNVNSATDQLTNIDLNAFSNWFCNVVSGGGINLWDQTAYTPPFSFTTSANSPVCPFTTGSVAATQSSGGGGPFTFNWTNNQTLVSYPGNNIIVPLGDYSLTITDGGSGCIMQHNDSAAYVQQISNVTGSINTTQASCLNGSATVTPSGGNAPYTFQWTNGATSTSINGLSQGLYSVTVTDAQGCLSSSLPAYIQQNPAISVNTTVTNATCVQSDGSATAFGSGGVNPYTYAWSNGQTGNTATNLSGGTMYLVTATDANGCIGQGNAFVNSSTPISVTYTSTPSQCLAPTGSATIIPTGGTPPYTTVWNVSPQVNGTTISNVAPGNYSFQVTDAVGCVRTGSAVVSPLSTINASIQSGTVVCPNTTGTVAVNASGSNPPLSYLWNTGATTNQISGVPLGGYSCVITDAIGCSVTKSSSLTSVSPVSVSVATVPVTCVFNTDGAANSTVVGGTAPYTYSYSNGTTTANATGLGMGNHNLSVIDANGCSSSQFFVVSNDYSSSSCYCTISGNVYVDSNPNCIYDTGEQGVYNVMIHCTGYGYTFTDVNGYYSFQVPSGTYSISEQINGYYPLASCQTNGVSVSVVAGAGCNSVVDIANDMNTIHDLKILTVNSTLPPIPGNSYQQKVIIQNLGTVTEPGVQLGYEHDGQLSFLNSSSPNFIQLNPGTSPNHFSVLSGFPSLSPNTGNTLLMNYNTPTNIPIGTVIDMYDSTAHDAPIATNWLLDYTPWNNVKLYQPMVIGSYDPNYKEVTPRGVGAPGYISSAATDFDYTIHFQNEGTYFAQNIYITDQLDADLDWTTLVPGYSDYSYTTTVSESGLVTFTFDNINLPWKSQYGDALSSGLISYSIQRNSSTPQGTEFTNTADIYFDYNAPITTNTTINTLNDEMAGVEEIDLVTDITEGVSVDIYPVPARDIITIRVHNVAQDEIATVSIIDLMGNIVRSEQVNLNEGSTAITQNISDLANGTYLTRIQFENGSFIVKKIVFSK